MTDYRDTPQPLLPYFEHLEMTPYLVKKLLIGLQVPVDFIKIDLSIEDKNLEQNTKNKSEE